MSTLIREQWLYSSSGVSHYTIQVVGQRIQQAVLAEVGKKLEEVEKRKASRC